MKEVMLTFRKWSKKRDGATPTFCFVCGRAPSRGAHVHKVGWHECTDRVICSTCVDQMASVIATARKPTPAQEPGK